MSFFGHKILDIKDISTKSLFGSNNQYLQKYNSSKCTIGHNFKGTNMLDNYINLTFLSINALPEFEFAYYEELRLTDDAKTQTGKLDKSTFSENDEEILISPNIIISLNSVLISQIINLLKQVYLKITISK